ALPSGPLRAAEPWRPLPVRLLPDGDNWLGAEKVLPPSADTVTTTGSDGSCALAERNCVQLTYTRPKNGLPGSRSAQIDSLSLKVLGLSWVTATTGALRVRRWSWE